MSRPWMPLYVADYLADTGHLSTVEHGAYMLLIMHYWQNGGLPNDDRKLARIARLPAEEWTAIRDTLADLFHPDWRHKRIDEEMAKAEQMLAKRAAAGKAGASARYGKRTAEAEQTNSLSPSPSHTQEKKKVLCPKPARGRVSYPAEFEEFWSGYPTDQNMSKKVAGEAWARLTPDDRQAATASLPSFRAYVAQHPDYRVVHAERYLRQRRFDGHLAAASPQSTGPPRDANGDTPEEAALRAKYRRLEDEEARGREAEGLFREGRALPAEGGDQARH